MSAPIVSGLFALAGIFLGYMIAWLSNRKRNSLEQRKLQLEIEQLERQIQDCNTQLDMQREKIIELSDSTQQEVKKYLSTLINDLSVWQGGLGLGRAIEMEEIYVWVELENDGEKRDVKYKDADLFRYLLSSKKGQNALIVGGPGSGKSTLIRRWAHTIARNCLEGHGEFVPLFISLHQLGQLCEKADLNWNVEELALKLLYGQQVVLHPGLVSTFTEAVANGKVIIFLDAADEVPEAARGFVLNWLNKLSAHSPHCLTVLTSRPCTYIDKVVNFEKYNMVEFNDDQITAFVDRWFSTLDQDVKAKKEIANRVLGSPLILRNNPLFLTMLCIVIERGSDEKIPSAGALFERFVRELLQHRAEKHKLSVETKIKLDVLQYIAYTLFERDRLTVQEEQLLEEVKSIIGQEDGKANLSNSRLVVKEIVETSGILQYNRIGYYGFYHPIFQEFFVARKVQQDIGKGIINETQWYEKYAFEEKYSNVFGFLHELIELARGG